MSDSRFQPWPESLAITALFEFCSWLLSHRKEVGIMVKIYGIDIQDVDELIFGDDERVICSER